MHALPCYPESEDAVLGVVLLSPTKGRDFATALGPQHFYAETNPFVAQAIIQVVARGQRPDPVTVLAELQGQGVKSVTLDRLRGLEGKADRVGWEQHHRRLKDAHALRELVHTASGAIDRACELVPPDVIIPDLSRRLAGISLGRPDAMKTQEEVMTSTVAAMEKRRSATGPSGVLFGVPALDNITTGLRPAQLCVIAGRTGGGKTSLAMQAVFRFAQAGGHCAVFNLEMTAEELGERALAHLEMLDSSRLAIGEIFDSDWERIRVRARALSAQAVHYEDRLRSVADICARAREWRSRCVSKPGLVVVDFLQLMRGSNPRDPRYRQVGAMAEELKALAKELEVPVVTLSQLARTETEADPPTLSQLKESGDIENAADIVIAGHNPQKNSDGEMELHVLKNRGGRTGKVVARWVGKHYLFTGTGYEGTF